MTLRENLFRPIHKGLRLMIYESGLRLGTTDYSNMGESNATVEMLRRDVALTSSNCLLCLFRAHSDHEEKDLFAPVRPHAPSVVEQLLVQHREILRRVQRILQLCDQIGASNDSRERMELGDRLNLECDQLFTFTLGHMVEEETKIVPLMWEHFTDAELRAFRSQFYNQIPLERFEDWMRWTLPALNLSELLLFLAGMKAEPTPNRFVVAMRVAQETLDRSRWSVVESQVGRDVLGGHPVG